MAERRGWGEDGIFFEHSGTCRDAKRHNGCPGRWRGVVSLGYSPDGKRRIRRKVSGKDKTAVKDKLKELHADLDAGLQSSAASYTLGDALDDWVAEGLDGRSEETIRRNRSILRPVHGRIGKAKLEGTYRQRSARSPDVAGGHAVHRHDLADPQLPDPCDPAG